MGNENQGLSTWMKNETIKKSDVKLSEYYLSSLLQNKKIQEKVKQHLRSSDTTPAETKRQYKRQQFTQFIESIPKTITTVAWFNG